MSPRLRVYAWQGLLRAERHRNSAASGEPAAHSISTRPGARRRRACGPGAAQHWTPRRPSPLPMRVSSSSIAPAPNRTRPRCSRTIRRRASAVSCPPSAARPMSRRLSDEEAIVNNAFGERRRSPRGPPPHARPRIESAQARGAAPVHVVARAGEHRTRDYGAQRLGAASRRLGGVTHHPRTGAAGKPWSRIREPMSSQWFIGRRVFLEHTKIPCDNLFVP